jgi:hypothetical protein
VKDIGHAIRIRRLEAVLSRLLVILHGTADHNALVNELLRDCPDAKVLLVPRPKEDEAPDAALGATPEPTAEAVARELENSGDYGAMVTSVEIVRAVRAATVRCKEGNRG